MRAKFSVQAKAGQEEQLKSPVESLLKAIAGLSVRADFNVIHEVQHPDVLGRPDIGVAVGKLLNGYIELKAPGKGANPTTYKGHDKKQWERFSKLPNLIYTDGIEWTLYRFGQKTRGAKFSADPTTLGSAALAASDVTPFLTLFADFLQWEPDVPKSAKQLASFLAPLCKMLKEDVLDALKRNSIAMADVARDWRRYLFPDADNATFADSYAQTVTFALLLVRSNGADTLLLDEAVQSLTATNTLLGRALQVLTDIEVRVEVGASLDMLQRVIHAVPAKTMTIGKRDPWLHFYEDFLQEYDPQLRKNAGAYYTPLPVVHAQTALVDDILRNRMDKPMGFAEGGVETLDPAVGTGTYLLHIAEHALDRVVPIEGAGAVKGRASLLARNLHGFEVMVGPYAVSALRMTRLFQSYGGGLPKDGVQIFLNNTLESPFEKLPELPLMYRAIGLEHQRAKRIKETVPILVCIGNPPYDRHAAATNSNKMATGGWVRWGESGDSSDAILSDFIDPVRNAGRGVTLKNLYNLYVYFWRWALWKVFEHDLAQGAGIVSYITASSFIDGDAFLGMRRKMRKLCDEIWIIDLGGSGRGTQQDGNVFAIQTPVAITIAVRYEVPRPDQPAKTHYVKLEGTRTEKFAKLEQLSALSDLKFEGCPDDWDAPFLPVRETQYSEWPLLTDLMPWQHSGCQFKRTWPIAPTTELLVTRWSALLAAADRSLAFRESRDRKIDSTVGDLLDHKARLEPLSQLDTHDAVCQVRRYGFRSFDRQYALVDNRLGDYLRPVLWQTASANQIYFASAFTQVLTDGPALTVSADVPDLHYFSGRGAKDIVPLFRDNAATQPNLHPQLLEKLDSNFGHQVAATNWACYMYSIMAHPGFTEKFRSDLASRELRVPITLDAGLFEQAVSLGKRLLYLHSFGERFSDEFPPITGTARCVKAIQTDGAIETYGYDEGRQVLRVGDGEFSPVSLAVWNFEVSGMKVLRSWLGYRMAVRSGKKTSPLDAIGLTEWHSELTTELLHLLWILEGTLILYSQQADVLCQIIEGETLYADQLDPVPDEYRKPPRSHVDQDDLFE